MIVFKFKLAAPLAPYSVANEYDVHDLKTALNQLGYYRPPANTGIEEMREPALFEALKAFQRDKGIPENVHLFPYDATSQALNRALMWQDKSGRYVWRTVGDSRVRDAHALREGEIFTWGLPPEGGHPGEDYNCRCWAEPIKEKPRAKGLTQVVISPINDASKRWTDLDFAQHFYLGGGKEKTLEEIGLLGPVIDHAMEIMFNNVAIQVAEEARTIENGTFTGSWNNSYEFGDVVYSIGGATIRGRFGGTVRKEDKVLFIEATTEYEFEDEFSDITSARELHRGPHRIKDLPNSPFAALELGITEFIFGNPYLITGKWVTKITGSILSNEK